MKNRAQVSAVYTVMKFLADKLSYCDEFFVYLDRNRSATLQMQF